MQVVVVGIFRLLARLGSFCAMLMLGMLAGGSVAALGAKAVVLVPAMACGLAMLWIPYSPLIAIVATVPVNIEIAGPLTISRLAIVLGFFVAAWQGVKGEAPHLHVPGRAGVLGLCFFAWAFFVGLAVPGEDGLLSRVGPYIVYAAIFFMVLIYTDSPERMRIVMITLVVAGTLQGLVVMAEVLLGQSLFGGGWHQEIADKQGSGEIRAVGTSSHPIILAGYFQVVMAACAMLLLTANRTRARLLLSGVLLLFLASWWLAFARTSWIGVSVMLFVVMVTTTRTLRVLAISGGAFMFVLLWIYDFSPGALISDIETLGTVQTASSRAGVGAGSEALGWRTENWIASVNMWSGSPLMGVGLDQGKQNMLANLPRGAIGHQQFSHEVPHNLFLNVLAEVGLPAFLMFVGLWLLALRGLALAWAVVALRPYTITIMAMLLGQLATFFFNPLPREVYLTLAMALALGRIAQKYGSAATAPAPARGIGRFIGEGKGA